MEKNKKKRDSFGLSQLAKNFNISSLRNSTRTTNRFYGSYLFGSRWKFRTLIGRTYCQSTEYDADKYPDLLQIVFILRKLKHLILNR